MPISTHIAALLLGISLVLLVAANRDDAIPVTAKSTDDVVAMVEKVKGFGCVQTAEFHHWGKRVFAVWLCPFSGRGDCYLYVYGFDLDKAQWILLENRLVPSGGDLSVELPSYDDTLLVRSTDGKLALKVPLDKVPTKQWWPTTQK